MGHAEHGHAVFGQADHGVQHLFHHLRIECRGRLVEQHDLRFHAQRAGNRHTLLLTTGELPRVLVGLLGNAHALEEMHGDFLGLALGHLAYPHRRQGAVLQHGEMREQVEVLEHHADYTANRLDVLEVAGQLGAIDHDAPLLVLFQAVDAANGGGLARTGRPAEDDTLALLHAEVDVLEHVELAVPLVHALQQDHRLSAGLLDCFTHNSLLSWG